MKEGTVRAAWYPKQLMVKNREAVHTCIQFVNMTQTDISLEKIFSSSGLVSMQSFRQLSRKLV